MTNKKSPLLRVCLVVGAGLSAAALSFTVFGPNPVTSARTQGSLVPVELPLPESAPPFRGFWESLHVHGDEAEGYPSLSEMAEAADHVVLGTLSNFRLNRLIQTGSPEHVVHMGAADLKVSRVVRGSDPGKVVVLEFLLTGPQEHMAAKIRQQAEAMPTDPALFFLRHKGGSEAGLYRIVNSKGLWVSDGESVTAPLAENGSSQPRPIAARAFSARDIARERAARPESLRRRERTQASPEAPIEANTGEAEGEGALYQDELEGIKTLDELARLVE